MKRYRSTRRFAPMGHDVSRWTDLCAAAEIWLGPGLSEHVIRTRLNAARCVHPIGAAGEVNPCTRLIEEIDRRLARRSAHGSSGGGGIPGYLRAGLDMDAVTADNAGEITRLVEEVRRRASMDAAVREAMGGTL